MTAEFSRMGHTFERVAAIDARNWPDLALMPLRASRKTSLRLTDAEIACLLSHRTCWSIVAEGDDAYGAVFEDDIVFSAKAGPACRCRVDSVDIRKLRQKKIIPFHSIRRACLSAPYPSPRKTRYRRRP